MSHSANLKTLLVEREGELRSLVQRRATRLLQHEAVEDLVQGIFLHALLNAGHFEWRGEGQFRTWLELVASQHLANRRAYWSARKRDAGAVLRIFGGGATTAVPSATIEPVSASPGPSTVAMRRETFLLAMRALSLLPPRDQKLIEWMREEVPISEAASRLGISHGAAGQARLRAVERCRRVFRLLGAR